MYACILCVCVFVCFLSVVCDLLVSCTCIQGFANNILGYAKAHRTVIERFGRYPHRNNLHNRESTPEEIAWLNSDEAPGWTKSQGQLLHKLDNANNYYWYIVVLVACNGHASYCTRYVHTLQYICTCEPSTYAYLDVYCSVYNMTCKKAAYFLDFHAHKFLKYFRYCCTCNTTSLSQISRSTSLFAELFS